MAKENNHYRFFPFYAVKAIKGGWKLITDFRRFCGLDPRHHGTPSSAVYAHCRSSTDSLNPISIFKYRVRTSQQNKTQVR
jgi:hypothetical protein